MLLQDSGYGIEERTEFRPRITPLLQGHFVRINYTWNHQEKPQQGSLLVGYGPAARPCAAHWIDSWHMGRIAMIAAGPPGPGRESSVRGGYAAPHGPDWR